MDRKTLEYMEERAGKARVICNKIEKLAKAIAVVERSSEFKIYGFAGPGVVEHRADEFVEAVKEVYVKTAQDRMDQLEKELSEL